MKRRYWRNGALIGLMTMAGGGMRDGAASSGRLLDEGRQTVKVGEAAAEFTASDSVGERHHLSDYRGKFVVLEWHSSACPLAEEQYESGEMQRLQKEWTSKGVVWLTVISSVPGKRGYVTPSEENDYLAKMDSAPTAALLDPSGQLGHLYEVQTTPEMRVINPQGALIYAGAMESRGATKAADARETANYVAQALSEAMAGQAVRAPVMKPQGCPAKYKD
jgi:hypothetical protein